MVPVEPHAREASPADTAPYLISSPPLLLLPWIEEQNPIDRFVQGNRSTANRYETLYSCSTNKNVHSDKKEAICIPVERPLH